MKSAFWDAKRPVAIAHRGGAGLYNLDRHRRENTLKAFQAATRLGYGYLELDVTSTRDNKVIVLHVTTDRFEAMLYKRSAPSAKRMQNLTHSELKTLLGRDIPTLGEIFQKFPDTKFLIDSKTDEVVEPLATEVIKAKAYSRVFLNSFYLHRVIRLQKLLGDKVTYGLVIGRYPRVVNRKLKSLKNGEYAHAGLTAVVIPSRFMEKRLVSLAHKQGLKVIVWTPNTRNVMERAIGLGVDAIVSDNIELLKEVINAKK